MAFGDIVRAMGGGVVLPPVIAPPPRQRPVTVVQRVATAPAIPVPPATPAPPPPSSVITPSKPSLDPRFLSRLIAQSDASPQASRSGGNADRFMHVSSLIGCCEREHCISQQHGLPTATSVSGPMRLIWSIGRAVEHHIRSGIIQSRDYRGVYGEWRCACEAVSYTGDYVRDRHCHVCRKPVNRYYEPTLSNDFYRVIGSPDLTLIENGYYMPIEIKSMNKDQFDGLTAPLADHCIQGCSYRWLYEQMGLPVLDVVPILYGRKDYKFGGTFSVYKEYHVNYSDWHRQVENNMKTSRRIADHNEGHTLPPRTLCSVPTVARAKDCARAALCFNL